MENEEGENAPHPNLVQYAKKRDYVRKDKARPHRLHFGRRLDVGGEIIDIRKPLNTIICSYAHCPRFFVPLKNKNGNYLRCLLPDELKQIQGFPKDYKLSGNVGKQIKQIGNAVPPPLIELIVDQLR
jgi:DNA (cytosine-5)-methyltransferase 1